MPSYEKSKSSGLWSCRFRETSPDGVTVNKRLSGYKTKKDAQYGYEDYIKTADDRQAAQKAAEEAAKQQPDEMLFDDLLSEFMKWKSTRVKESSFYDIQSKVNNRLVPYFTGKRFSEITPKAVSDWITTIEYSYASKKWIMSTLSSIYKYGSKYYDITNIMDKVDRPRDMEMPQEMEVWTPQEFNTFIKEVKKPLHAALFRTLYIMGCRRGEAAALTWADVDFDNRTVRINKSVTNKTKQGAYAITTPKNKNSIRTVGIPRSLADELSALRTDKTKESDYVFGGERPPATSSVDYAFKHAASKAGVKQIRLHDLRHSCASLLISKGVSIVAVSRRLGHKNIEQTLNTYSHLMPDDQTKMIAILSEI